MASFITILQKRWREPGGYYEALQLAFPLILSSGSWTLQTFIDRVFLCWWRPDAMGASLAAGILQWTAVAFFLGTASYANTFVAQYYGARRPDCIGPAVWQSIYFSLLSFVVLLALIPLADPIFRLAGHTPELRAMETSFFRILCLGSGFNIYSSAISGFFSGRGKTWPVLWVNVFGMIMNVVLDYILIFGHFGAPAMGIRGAAWATDIAQLSGAIIFSILYFSPRNRREFSTARGWHFEPELFKRLLRYGLPSGLHFMADGFVFMLFVELVGRIGAHELAATTMAFNINMLAFMPMIGFGIATATLVGQALGANEPDRAAKSSWSVFHLTFFYMAAISVFYVLTPNIFIAPFAAQAQAADFAVIRPIAVVLLRFVAFYCLFDTLNIIFASSLKGAGDTKFVMWMTLGLGLILMVIPTYLSTGLRHGGLMYSWISLTLYVCILGLVFLYRFLQGKWRSMRVIEPLTPAMAATHVPETPPVDIEM